jgi:CoA:oxalate CoA-transferase
MMTSGSVAQGPLAGVIVVDFTRVLAGPYATALLADLGARVIKVEPREGDDYRHVGPWLGNESALFASVNRGKESIVLDLKEVPDLEFALQLCDRADVVVENFRPGVAAKLGIGAEALMARNPGVVYASISGFGQAGPYASRPAYDIIVQALTGLMSINGDPSGPPTLVGESIGDVAAGLYGSWAILAALVQRARTGVGCRIDLAMFDALLAMMPLATTRYLATGTVPQRVGNRHALSAPFGAFRTGDGHVVVAVLNSKLFERFASVIGKLELAHDERFATDSLRKANEEALRVAFEDWSTQRSTEDVVAALTASGVPATRISDVGEAVESEHAKTRGLFRRPAQGTLDLLVPEQPATFSTMGRGRPAAAPRLDEHAAAIRAWVAGR